MVSGVGPTKTRPAAATASAKRAFSERNPYPGWIAPAPRLARGGNDRVDIEIAFAGRRRTDADCLVGIAHGETVLVSFAEHGDGAHIEFLRRADDAHGDFAAIGD